MEQPFKEREGRDSECLVYNALKTSHLGWFLRCLAGQDCHSNPHRLRRSPLPGGIAASTSFRPVPPSLNFLKEVSLTPARAWWRLGPPGLEIRGMMSLAPLERMELATEADC